MHFSPLLKAALPPGLAILACTCADGSSESVGWMGSIDTTDGSVVVRTTVPPGDLWPIPLDVGPINVLWNSDRLAAPNLLTASSGGDTVVITNATEAFVLSASGRLLATLGRRGKGPGEFMSMDGISPPYGDSLLIWDGALARLTWMRMDGSVLETRPVRPPGMFRRPRPITLYALGDWLVLPWSFGLIRTDGVADSVVFGAVSPYNNRTIRVATIEDMTWTRLGGVVGSATPFGPKALYAISPAGRLAVTAGVEYCVRVTQIHETSLSLRLCRDWKRQPVGDAGSPPPDLDEDTLGRIGPILRRVVLEQKPGDLKNSIDALNFDTSERLWVRVVDSTLRYHPSYMGQVIGLRPRTYTWEVFAPDGRLVARVRVPSVFRPMWIGQERAIGFLDAEDGTVSIAWARLPAFLEE